MVDVKFIAPTPIGGTDIQYAQGVRAGPWLFFTGHMRIPQPAPAQTRKVG